MSFASTDKNPGSLLSKVEALLKAHPGLTPAEICKRIGETTHKRVRGALGGLVRLQRAHAEPINTTIYAYYPGARPATTKATPVRHVSKEIYSGAELRPFTGRQGAMRAFDLPSLVNGRVVPRVKPQHDCVGRLRDSVSHGRD
jgi:hypothetical protein